MDRGRAPESLDNQASGRRRFLKVAVGVLTGAATVALAAPLVVTLIGPMYRRQKGVFTSIGRVDALPQGEPVSGVIDLGPAEVVFVVDRGKAGREHASREEAEL